MTMELSDRGLAFIAAHEGIVPGPYRDSVGVWTYGIGHTAAAGAPDPATLPRGMPDDIEGELDRVFSVFRADIARYEADVRRAVTAPMSQHEFDAAVSFHYNTGGIGRASWVKSWNAGKVDAARQQIMNWKRPPEIEARRRAEQALWTRGEYGDTRVVVWKVTDSGRVIWKALRTYTQGEIVAALRPQERPEPPVRTPTPRNRGMGAGAAVAAGGGLLAWVAAKFCLWPWLANLLNITCGG